MSIIITPNTIHQLSDDNLLKGAEGGNIVVQNIGFFESLVLRIVQLIASAKAKLRTRVDEAEAIIATHTQQIAELQEALGALQIAAKVSVTDFTKSGEAEQPTQEQNTTNDAPVGV